MIPAKAAKDMRDALLSLASLFSSLFFISLALLPHADSRWLAAAAAGYFLPRAQSPRHTLPALLVFVLLGLFHWGALIAGVALFAAFINEIWSGSGSRWRQCGSAVAAAFCMTALLFAGIPAITFNADHISIALPQLLTAAAAAALPAMMGMRRAPAAPALDPLLLVLLSALTLCYALSVALLAGSIAYPEAILLTAAGGCVMLVAIAVLTMPFMRGGTLDMLQHIFMLHVPVEKWVADISVAAAEEGSAATFLDLVMRRFLALPGVVGVRWRLNDFTTAADVADMTGKVRAAGGAGGTDSASSAAAGESAIGVEGRQHVDLHCPPLFIRLYTRRRASPWDWFNYYLLARISSEYCRAKQREEQQRTDNLSRALHQTGARLTHDIKNILHTLTALAQAGDEKLIRRQLPALCDRLESTLAKLQAPDVAAGSRMMTAAEWWAVARRRYAHQPVAFADAAPAGDAPAEMSADVPVELFDLALDNFTANAQIKRQTNSGIAIDAQLLQVGGKPALRVRDSGGAVDAATAAVLFRQPVESETGFGIALYQVQLEAEKYGYRARLLENAAGGVVFDLSVV